LAKIAQESGDELAAMRPKTKEALAELCNDESNEIYRLIVVGSYNFNLFDKLNLNRVTRFIAFGNVEKWVKYYFSLASPPMDLGQTLAFDHEDDIIERIRYDYVAECCEKLFVIYDGTNKPNSLCKKIQSFADSKSKENSHGPNSKKGLTLVRPSSVDELVKLCNDKYKSIFRLVVVGKENFGLLEKLNLTNVHSYNAFVEDVGAWNEFFSTMKDLKIESENVKAFSDEDELMKDAAVDYFEVRKDGSYGTNVERPVFKSCG